MKGQAVSIDFLAAMTIFIFMIVAGFYIVQSSLVPTGGFEQQVAAAADAALVNFEDETEWTVYKTPVAVRSEAPLENEPVKVNFPFPGGIVENSTLVTREGRELRSQHNHSSNTTVILADIRNGTTRLDVVYSLSGSMDDRNYSSSLVQEGSSAWNDRINVTFTTNGFSQLSYDGTDLLQSDAHLAGGASPAFDEDLLKVNATYSSGRKHVRVFEDSGQIRVTEFFTGEREWSFNLTSGFDTLYSSKEKSITSIDGSGIVYSASTDWVDFNDSSKGLSFIGDEMYVNVTRDSSNSRVEVAVNFSDSNGRKDLLIYAHGGNYTNATAQKQDFYHPYEAPVGVPEPVEGVSRDDAASLQSRDYEAVQDRLGLTGLEYNISIEGVFKEGKNVDTGSTVTVVDFPVAVAERFGNASVKSMVMRIWR